MAAILLSPHAANLSLYSASEITPLATCCAKSFVTFLYSSVVCNSSQYTFFCTSKNLLSAWFAAPPAPSAISVAMPALIPINLLATLAVVLAINPAAAAGPNTAPVAHAVTAPTPIGTASCITSLARKTPTPLGFSTI